ncbi:MAG: dipicolinate synthase subunit B [Oscillospiraceae bacterium]|nr:dipicolinate synthase subunit B [Oscillospiraceae bacterium]
MAAKHDFSGVKIGFAVTASFCTFGTAFNQARLLREAGAELFPIMSENSFTIDTRFGKAAERAAEFAEICGREIIKSIIEAEPIGPENMVDIMLVCPCTGNTLAKLANSITDNAVTMAVKSHLRNNLPVVLCIATNDALSGSAKNIGGLLNYRNYYFVPFGQDDYLKKPTSLVADFNLVCDTLKAALGGRQVEPVVF